ncbi:hypothetical protein LINGRAHAP2_LOCUS1215 [Linum grandiflorum]
MSTVLGQTRGVTFLSGLMNGGFQRRNATSSSTTSGITTTPLQTI